MGGFYAISTVLEQTMTPFGYTTRSTGIFGFIMIAVGIFGATLLGILEGSLYNVMTFRQNQKIEDFTSHLLFWDCIIPCILCS